MSESERLPKPLTATPVCFQVISCLMSIAQLVIGAVNQHNCSQQTDISTYLLVMGVIALLLALLTMMPCTWGYTNHSTVWICLVSLFFYCFFIAGITWIYSIDEPNYNKTTNSMDTFCNNTLYQFALWTTNLNYILLLCIIFCSCCTCVLFGGDEGTRTQ